jgi:hypothetical protein
LSNPGVAALGSKYTLALSSRFSIFRRFFIGSELGVIGASAADCDADAELVSSEFEPCGGTATCRREGDGVIATVEILWKSLLGDTSKLLGERYESFGSIRPVGTALVLFSPWWGFLFSPALSILSSSVVMTCLAVFSGRSCRDVPGILLVP